MGLCSCVGGGNKVQQDSEAEKEHLGRNGYEKSINGASGLELHAYFWPAEPKGQPRAVVQLLHGSSTYIEFDFLKFQEAGKPNVYEGSWVQEMNKRGYAVCGFDFQGLGRSAGTRSYVERFDDYVDDMITFVRHVRESGDPSFPDGCPHFLLGYSLGALVGVMASLRQPGWFAGMVLISPLLTLERRAEEIKGRRRLLKLLSSISPKKEVATTTDDIPIQWIQDAWKADPLVYDGRVRARNAEQFFLATEQLASEDGPPGMGCVSVPLLVFQGGRDTVVEPAGADKLVARAATHEKRLRPVPGSWHVLVKEEGNEELLAETIDWLDEQSRTDRTKGLFRLAPTEDARPKSKPLAPEPAEEGDGGDGGDEDTDGGSSGPELPGLVAPSPGEALPMTSYKSLQSASSTRSVSGPAKSVSFGSKKDEPERYHDDDPIARMVAAAGVGQRDSDRPKRGSDDKSDVSGDVDWDEQLLQDEQVDPDREEMKKREEARKADQQLPPQQRNWGMDEDEPPRRRDPWAGGDDDSFSRKWPRQDSDMSQPAAPSHPPSSLPPLGNSRFSPLPPLSYGS